MIATSFVNAPTSPIMIPPRRYCPSAVKMYFLYVAEKGSWYVRHLIGSWRLSRGPAFFLLLGFSATIPTPFVVEDAAVASAAWEALMWRSSAK